MLKDKLQIVVCPNREEMGKAAAVSASERIISLIKEKGEINVVFAAAPSQNEFLEALTNNTEIQWDRVNAFHLDEYIGLNPEASQGFGNFLRRQLFEKVMFKSVNYLNGNGDDMMMECDRYSSLLKKFPLDIACIGIGENGHLAFNDPAVADFKDTALVKVVELDEVCRRQQVNDGCFSSIMEVPTHALTLTIPAIMSAAHIYCIVPGKTKAAAIEAALNGVIEESCPASILRSHPSAKLFLDENSAELLNQI